MKKRLQTQRLDYSLYPWRVNFLWLVILFLGVVVIIRLFWLQVVKGDDYAHLAERQHYLTEEVAPERGIIYTQDTRTTGEAKKVFPLATNGVFYLIYAQTYDVTDPETTVKKLNSVLDLPEKVVERLQEQVAKYNDPYEPLAHRVTEDKINQLAALNLPGIKWEKETLRYYPQKNLGSALVGFVGWVDDELVGQYGIEGYFDEQLKGQPGLISSERDSQGRLIGVGEHNDQPVVNGADIYLTVDDFIQSYACQKLDEAVKKYDADGGAVVALNPRTGAVLALCGQPDYDPNAYNEVADIRDYTNPAIFAAYEPGSVFKPLTLSAALDQGKITPEMIYEDTGEVTIGPDTIKNSDLKSHGVVTMVDVLKLSLNTGAIFAMRQIGGETLLEYLEKFGFGQLSGITLDKEVAGTIDSLRQRGEIYPATASFGQGIMVTPLQLVNAYAAIANGGTLFKPYVVEKIVAADGQVSANQPTVVRSVISQRAAALISGMMVQVVEAGYGQRARVPGYYLAGKTGTAQVATKGAGEYGDQTIHTFVGFGPVSNPVFALVVRLDNPTAARFAESTATPVWGEIARFILNYYQVEPDEVNN